nr:TetR/AcrR family transcriptional regulator [Ancylobacter gelatini]
MRATAACLFVTHGYDGVSLDEIVRVAGGSKTNIYAFFGGKEGLFLAAIEHACGQILAPFHEVELDGLGLEAGLARLGEALLDQLLTPRHLALFRLVIGETARFPQLGALWYRSGPGVTQARIAAFIRARRPGIDDDHAADLARMFHDMAVQDLLHRALFAPDLPSARERTRIVARAAVLVVREAERG